jgi:tRNA(fMet)-specific endonuclease VapC
VYVLDSDILSIIQDRKGEEFQRIERRMAMTDPRLVHVSIVTFQEQANGWSNYVRRARKPGDVVHGYRMFERLLTEFFRLNILSFDDSTSNLFESLKAQKVRIGTMDLRIAATALSKQFIVVTRNTVDFERVPGLRVEDWTTG